MHSNRGSFHGGHRGSAGNDSGSCYGGSSVGNKGSMKKKNKKRLQASVVRTVGVCDSIMFMPEARDEEDNGWQARCEDVKTRIAMLFNCYTMSDVVFQVEVYNIPAHKFVLGTASPVFCKMLCEETRQTNPHDRMRSGSITSEGGLSQSQLASLERPPPMIEGNMIVPISEVPHMAFFEFLQFIYTDNVNISLDNVLQLIFLADTYKVAGLSEHCFEFLRSEIVPHSVLRVLKILRDLLLKAIMTMWRDVVEQKKALTTFRGMSLAEKREKLREMDEGESNDGASDAGRSHVSGQSRRQSVSSRRSGRSGSRHGFKDTEESGHDTESIADDQSVMDSELDAAIDFKKKKGATTNTGFKGQMLKIKISAFVEGLLRKCWRCIQEDTGAVISCPDFWDQDILTLRTILRLDTCSVFEISLFRACNEWAERQCRKSGLPINEINKRDTLGQATLHLFRFPVMTRDEFQWEVVPTGMLCYEDVQQLLHSMAHRSESFGSTYNNKPRSMRTLKDKGRDLEESLAAQSTFIAPDKPVYSCVEDDPLDCMLGAELLKAFLNQTVDNAGPRSTASEPPTSPSASRSRLALSRQQASSASLPPLTPRAGGREPAAPLSPRPAGASRPRREPAHMVMGIRIDTEESQDGIVVQGGGRRPLPNDFFRLAPGFYRFRDEFLIEIWLREGEAMVTSHGHNPAMDAGSVHFAFHNAPVDAFTARSLLGIPFGKAAQKGGVPLVSFLCRQ